jgi:hypothetical protein
MIVPLLVIALTMNGAVWFFVGFFAIPALLWVPAVLSEAFDRIAQIATLRGRSGRPLREPPTEAS